MEHSSSSAAALITDTRTVQVFAQGVIIIIIIIIIAITFDIDKLEWYAYLMVKKLEDMFIHFDRIDVKDRQTDRHRMTT